MSALPEGTRLLIGFDMPVVTAAPMPLRRARAEDEDDRGEAAEERERRAAAGAADLVDPVAETIAALRRKGFGRLYVDGRTVIAGRRRSGDAARIAPMLQVIVDRVKIDGEFARRG